VRSQKFSDKTNISKNGNTKVPSIKAVKILCIEILELNFFKEIDSDSTLPRKCSPFEGGKGDDNYVYLAINLNY